MPDSRSRDGAPARARQVGGLAAGDGRAGRQPRERIWLQPAPQGDLEILYLEVDDPARAFQEIAASQEPFDVWFRGFALEHYGLDLTQPLPGPLPELILDWSADE